MLPEPVTGVYESALPTSSHGINETESENFVYIALETTSDNDEIAGEKMSFSSSAAVHSFETTVQDTDLALHSTESLSTEGQVSQLSDVVVSSELFVDRVEGENIEAVTAEPGKEEEVSYISLSREEPCGEGVAQTKKVTALILDSVYTYSHTPTDGATVKEGSASVLLNEKTQGKQDHETLAPPEAEISDVAIEPISNPSSLNEQTMVNVSEITLAVEPEQSQLIDIDNNGQMQTTAAPTSETQCSEGAASRDIGTFSWNNGPNDVIADRESNWTTNNGPPEIQRRYIILDFPEGVELQRHHAHEDTLFREPTETQIQGSERSVSERMETECDAKTESEIIARTNRTLEASKQSELVEASLKRPKRQVGEVMHFIVEETKKTPTGDKMPFIEVDPKFKPPIKQQNEVETEVQQINKVHVSATVEDKPEGEEAIEVILGEETKTQSGGKAQSKKIEPELTHPIKLLVDWDTEVQPEIINVSPEEKPEFIEAADVIVEEEMNKTPSGEKTQFMESEPKMTPPLRRNYNKTDVQSNKVNVSTQKEKAEGEEDVEVTVEETTSSDNKAQSIEAEPELTPSIKQQNDQKTEVQSEKGDVSAEEKIECEEALHVIAERNDLVAEVQSEIINVSLTPEEKHEVVDTADVIVQEETNKTPSDEKAHSIEAEPKPTPPVRQRNEKRFDVQSDKLNISTTSDKKPEGTEVITVIVEDALKMTPSDNKAQSLEAEPILTPPVRQQNEGETDVQSNQVKLSTTSEEKPGDTMHIIGEERTKNTLVDKVQSTEAEPKPTPPVRRRNEGETEVQLDKEDVIPTPPTRQCKGDKLSLDIESQIEGEVLPTPPSRRRREKIGIERFSLDLESQPTPPARRRKEKEDRRLSLDLETQPTPPARRRKEKEGSKLSLNLETEPTPPARPRKEKEDSQLSLYLETQPTPPERRCKEKEDRRLSLDLETQPTPPTRRRKENEGSKLSLNLETEPTPPARQRKEKEGSKLSLNLETEPTPPARQRKEKEGSKLSLNLETEPTPPARQRKEKEGSKLSLNLETEPTPPVRRCKEKEGSKLSLNLETEPTPPVRRCKEKEGSKLSLNLETEPTPPARRRKEKEDSQLSLYLETEPTPPARRCKEKEGSALSIDLEPQPTPPSRRRKDKPESDMLFYSAELGKSDNQQTGEHKDREEHTVKPTPPVRCKISQVESDVAVCKNQEEKEAIVKPTPPTMKDSKIENEIVAGASNLKEDMSIHKPTPPLRRKDSQEETEMVSTTPKSQPEEVLPTPPTRQKKDQIEADRVPLMPEEPQVISTPTTSDKESPWNEKVSMCARLELEADVEAIPKQEDKDETDSKSLVGQEQQEEGQDSTLVPEPISVISQTESVSEMQVTLCAWFHQKEQTCMRYDGVVSACWTVIKVFNWGCVLGPKWSVLNLSGYVLCRVKWIPFFATVQLSTFPNTANTLDLTLMEEGIF